ncbi:cytochrome c [Agriterribacter sp.]|uniref:c-type cytochrome n=1 Tax=Agriterribacter sp. TaxID=2821509 RepID=UPI002C369E54|nr:cytochrome c [Agriterribacter sp.]HTN08626.1 cytochrome c [Agriterribacter sp.]
MKQIPVIACVFVAVVLTVASCSNNNKKPGATYMPDMAYSRAYETNSENDIFPDKQTNRTPVAGTITRGQLLPFRIEKDAAGDTSNFAKARTVQNPLPALNEADLKEAERLYLIYCGICHGSKLDGNGPLWKDGDGPFPAAPKNLLDPAIVSQGDGQIFYTITYGKNKMGSYASQLNPKQRWMVIDYMRGKQGVKKDITTAVSDSSAAAK